MQTMRNDFFDSAGAQLVVDVDLDRILAANKDACDLFSRALPELVGESATYLFQHSLGELITITQEAMFKGKAMNDKLLIQTPKGQHAVVGKARFSETESLQALYVGLECLEEQKRSQQKLEAQEHYQHGIGHWNRVSQVFQEFERENQLLLDAAGEGIYGVDAQGMTTFTNPAAQQILGYAPEELFGRNMHTTVHHKHADGSHYDAKDCPIFAVFSEGITKKVEEDIFWSKDGEPVDVAYVSTPVRDNGQIVGAVVVFRDITQNKAYQRQLLEALKEVESLKNRLEMEKAYLQEEISAEFNHHRLIGRSPALQRCLQQIDLVAPTQSTVLIHGESGTGKELIARAIHENGERAGRPLIRVNCAAIPEDLFESEFFGHIKGSFTGATSDRAGRFELADGGTLFLDEVGEIPMHLQGKLLRVLQEQQFERIGDSSTRHVDVRIIAATNKDLYQMVQDGTFREDLYFRLNVFPIESIPLRDRKEDIPLLTRHFLDKASKRSNKSDLKIPMSEIAKLQSYAWPGNIRELENVIERQVILSPNDTVRFDNLTARTEDTTAAANIQPREILTQQALNDLDRRNIISALKQCKGKVFGEDGAAKLLQMKPTTLSSRMKKYQISARTVIENDLI